ncbi:MAG: hypothetical protein ACKOJI_00565 [Phycisphaerales bacterium]
MLAIAALGGFDRAEWWSQDIRFKLGRGTTEPLDERVRLVAIDAALVERAPYRARSPDVHSWFPLTACSRARTASEAPPVRPANTWVPRALVSEYWASWEAIADASAVGPPPEPVSADRAATSRPSARAPTDATHSAHVPTDGSAATSAWIESNCATMAACAAVAAACCDEAPAAEVRAAAAFDAT